MKKRSFKSLIGLGVLATLLASCAAPAVPSTESSQASSNQPTGDININDYSSLNVTAKGYLNGKEDTDNTAATVEVETKDNITGVVIVSVKLKNTYGIYNAVARGQDGRAVTFSNSSKVGTTVRYYLQLSDSDLTVSIYLGKDVTTSLPAEGWNSLLEAITSPINSANISSDEADTYMNANLSFSNYFYVGTNQSGGRFSTQHNFYSSRDIESNSVVPNPESGNMSQVYLGANNKPGYTDLFLQDGSPIPWYQQENKYFNSNPNSQDIAFSPYQETPLSLFAIPAKGSTDSDIDRLKKRFSVVANGDGNITFTNKISSTDYSVNAPSIYAGLMLFSMNNNVYGAFMKNPDPAGSTTLKINMNLNDYKIQSITLTQPWYFQETNATSPQIFTFKAEFTSWNNRTYAEAYPGSWVKENAAVSDIYKPFETLDPNPAPLQGNATEAISAAPALAKLREGNYSLDIKTLRISSDGWFDGLGASDAPFEGTLKVNVSDETTTNKNKGVVSTLPTVTGRNTSDYNATGFYNGVFGKLNADKTGLTAYGRTSATGAALATTKLASNDIPLTAFFKGNDQGFQFAKEYFNEQGTFQANNAIFTSSFDTKIRSNGLLTSVFKQLGNPLDFAFGPNPFEASADANFALHYGYIANLASLKRVTVDFSKANEINITFDGTVRLYGDSTDFTITYRYYDIGTTNLTDQEAAVIAQIK